MTTTHPEPDVIMAWGDGELAPAEAAAVDAHILTCPPCRSLVGEFHHLSGAVRGWVIEPAPPGARAGVLRAAVVARRALADSERRAAVRPPLWAQHGWRALGVAATVGLLAAGAQLVRCGGMVCGTVEVADEGWFVAVDGPSPVGSSATAPAVSAASEATTDFERRWLEQPRVDLGVPAGDAAVVVVLLLDYACPTCAGTPKYRDTLDPYASDRPGGVRVVVRDFPLNAECNPNVIVTVPGHEASCAAAVAVRLAERHGRGAAMASWLLERQGLTVEGVRRAARSVGGVSDFDARYQETVKALRASIGVYRTPIRSAPSLFVNGRPLHGANGGVPSLDDLRQAIRFELRLFNDGGAFGGRAVGALGTPVSRGRNGQPIDPSRMRGRARGGFGPAGRP